MNNSFLVQCPLVSLSAIIRSSRSSLKMSRKKRKKKKKKKRNEDAARDRRVRAKRDRCAQFSCVKREASGLAIVQSRTYVPAKASPGPSPFNEYWQLEPIVCRPLLSQRSRARGVEFLGISPAEPAFSAEELALNQQQHFLRSSPPRRFKNHETIQSFSATYSCWEKYLQRHFCVPTPLGFADHNERPKKPYTTIGRFLPLSTKSV